MEKIIEIVRGYDNQFRENGRETWYKDFWKEFRGELDVFNLNYDTSIEFSLHDFNDGFVGFTQDYERFEPEVLWNAGEGQPTVSHLHGCYLYGDFNPKPVENYYSHRDLYKLYSDQEPFISRQWLPMNQVGEGLFYSPIITGLKKTDKICYLPHSYYHAYLAKRIIDNPSLLICGYSFGDLYVNQLLQRHKLIHDQNERVVIVRQLGSSLLSTFAAQETSALTATRRRDCGRRSRPQTRSTPRTTGLPAASVCSRPTPASAQMPGQAGHDGEAVTVGSRQTLHSSPSRSFRCWFCVCQPCRFNPSQPPKGQEEDRAI